MSVNIYDHFLETAYINVEESLKLYENYSKKHELSYRDKQVHSFVTEANDKGHKRFMLPVHLSEFYLRERVAWIVVEDSEEIYLPDC